MSLLEVLAIAVGLAMDAFAVSVGAGAGGHVGRPRAALRLAFHLGLFQALMPVLGWYAGIRVASAIAAYDHWVDFGLLAAVGARMVHSGLRPRGTSTGPPADPSRGLTLVALSVATSLDAFAVGLSLAMLGIAIWQPSAVIGLVTGALSLVGIVIGHRLGRHFGPSVEILGGLVLILIGLHILAQHLLAT